MVTTMKTRNCGICRKPATEYTNGVSLCWGCYKRHRHFIKPENVELFREHLIATGSHLKAALIFA